MRASRLPWLFAVAAATFGNGRLSERGSSRAEAGNRVARGELGRHWCHGTPKMGGEVRRISSPWTIDQSRG